MPYVFVIPKMFYKVEDFARSRRKDLKLVPASCATKDSKFWLFFADLAEVRMTPLKPLLHRSNYLSCHGAAANGSTPWNSAVSSLSCWLRFEAEDGGPLRCAFRTTSDLSVGV